MIFWPHNNDLGAPPELEDLRYRRPSADYWESPAGDKETALPSMWKRWKRETGRDYPRALPLVPAPPRHGLINRMNHSRRPPHYVEKNRQDRETR